VTAYYNEFDRQKAAWLRNLIEEGEVAHGIVDERSIEEVQPDDLAGFTQHHFFAGIGLWSLCLRRAGWPDDRPVWTGSCPCGPFSIAGKQEGFEDPRHLWPEWFRLIGERRPRVVFGEQSDQALAWLDLVQGDLEGRGYAFGAVDIPAAGFGGAHRRNRLGFVADTDHAEWWSDRAPWHDGHWPKTGRVKSYGHLGDGGPGLGVGHAGGARRGRNAGADDRTQTESAGARLFARGLSDQPGPPSATGGPGVAQGDTCLAGLPDAQLGVVRRAWGWGEGGAVEQSGDPLWAGVDWLLCRDSKWRPIESGLSPLVDASPARMVRLRGYGDGIDVEAFTNLIAAYMDEAPA
jgi:DNA (cytosine-5)-methyltransferase 1